MARDATLHRLQNDLTGGAVRLLVLAAVQRNGPVHGYRLIKDLEENLDLPKGIKASTIYPILEEFEKNGAIESRWTHGGSGPQRRSYEVTPKGRRILREASRAWLAWRDAVDAVLPRPELDEPLLPTNGARGARTYRPRFQEPTR